MVHIERRAKLLDIIGRRDGLDAVDLDFNDVLLDRSTRSSCRRLLLYLPIMQVRRPAHSPREKRASAGLRQASAGLWRRASRRLPR